MCEQTPVDYKDGDIVWVKLGPCWWPGEVRDLDKLPQEWFADFKKRPLAAVKFFDEDTYEYVRSIDKIYSYNCTRKNEFIRKGLDLHRAKNVFMDKFPADVCTAEGKTDGDPNILEGPLFSPEKKPNFAALFGGSTKSKKPIRKSGGIPRRLSSSSTSASPSSSSKVTPNKMITHRRFLGEDDHHEVRILVQSPDKAELDNEKSESTYNCTSCGFTTTRIDVIVLHNKSHIQGVYSTPTSTAKRGKRPPARKSKQLKMTRSKTSSIVEDLALIEKGVLLCTESSDEEGKEEEEEDDDEIQPKRKRRKNKRKPKKVQVKKEEDTKVDIRDNLLAEWDEEDSEAEEVAEEVHLNTSSTAESDASLSKVDDLKTTAKVNSEKKVTDKSCFDFEEEEENEIIGTSVGRKIPRVIPHTDRQKTIDPGKDDASLPFAEEDVNRKEQIIEVNNTTKEDCVSTVHEEENKEEVENKKKDVAAFTDILEATVVPDLPELPHSLKCEQNFHNAKTIKFPDKSELKLASEEKSVVPKLGTKEASEVSAKLINPKKRFVKSFEDFEQQWNTEQKKLTDPEEQLSSNSEPEKSTEPETQLPSEENIQVQPEPQAQNEQTEPLPKIKRKASPEPQPKSELRISPEPELQPQSEQRKSVELEPIIMSPESELQSQNEKESERRMSVEPEPESEPKSELRMSPEPQPKAELRTSAEPEPPPKIEPEQQLEKGSTSSVVEVSKLKTQLMSKLENAEKLLPRESSLRSKRIESQRHSRSLRERILEQKKEEKADDPWFMKKLNTDVAATVELPSSRNRLKSPPKIQKTVETAKEIDEAKNDIAISEAINRPYAKLYNKKSRRSSGKASEAEESLETTKLLETAKEIPESKSRPHSKPPHRKLRRLSVKMPEVEETLEIEQTTELLEPTEMVQVEQAKILEVVDQSIAELPQVEQIVTEIPRTELQTIESHLDFDNSLNELNVIEATDEQPNLIVEESPICDIYNQEQIYEDHMMEHVDDDMLKEELCKTQIEDSTFEIKHDEVLHIPEMPEAETEEKKEVDQLISMQLDAETNSNIEQYDHESISLPDVRSENYRIDSKDSEDLSALTTLAAVSELTTNLDIIQGSNNDEKSKIIEGNLTFVTEDDLADGQVEIANISNVDEHKSKPVTLSSFSVDFTDPNQTVNTASRTNKRKHSREMDQSEIIEKSLEKVFEEEPHSATALKSMRFTSVTRVDAMNPANMHDDTNCDIEDQIPSLVVCSSKQPDIKNITLNTNYLEQPEYTSSSKLLEILTDGKPKSVVTHKSSNIFDSRKIDLKLKEHKGMTKFDPKNSKFIIKSTTPSKSIVAPPVNKSNKPIILSEKIIKPLVESESVSVQRVTSKRNNQDIDDIDAFIIQKPSKKIALQEVDVIESNLLSQPTKKPSSTSRGKAKILQHTIIAPASEVIQTNTTTVASTSISQTPLDDNMFDINSMPIVLGDQILTAEGIESMPVVLSDSTPKSVTINKSQSEQVKLLNKPATSVTTQPMFVKTYSSQKLSKSPRMYQTSTTKVVKTTPAIITRPGKPDKFIIVPSGSATPSTVSKYTVGKRPPPPVVKRSSPVILPTPASGGNKVQTSSEPTGNKIMIVTNQQGQQSRVLLTPAQQKLLGYQPAGSKLVKNTLKGNILQKASNIKTTVTSKLPGVMTHAVVNSKGEIVSASSTQNLITADGQILMPVKSQQLRTLKTDTKTGRKIHMQTQKVLLQDGLNALKGSTIPGQQKTIVIKNQQGQIMKKFQGTDDALLEQQVAEQVQAIKASGSFSAMKARQDVGISKIKPTIKRSYPKKPAIMETTRTITKTQMVLNSGTAFASPKLPKSEASVPPLAPISPKRSDTLLLSQSVPKSDDKTESSKDKTEAQKPVNQLIIQDSLGNQTTITEGQILALPSGETIDGQPQSYMLVTLDEAGNLAPLNNEALLSLDPNLCLGGDLSNMVLQIDDGSIVAKPDDSASAKANDVKEPTALPTEEKELQPPPEEKPAIPESLETPNNATETSQQNLETVQTVTCSIGSDPNQQLIITGDPISTQKFIESLTEGNPDLANLLASAEGNILIHTDEQQILINTDADNQVLLPMNADNLGVIETSEANGNPMFATQPPKNQDILAAALADTDVFQQDPAAPLAQNKLPQSQLSPSSGLYPSGVSSVLGTTLSLSSPIMTPLEVPSSNSKKIPDDETDILTTEIPKNVDLPITITDPNISQTVAQQQVASLIASELASNLDLPLTISDQGVPLTSAEMNSPSFVYSLPSLDESVDIHQKTFSGPISMPLLTEESPNEEKEKSTLPEDILQSVSAKSTSLISETKSLFESPSLSTSDCIKESRKLRTTRTFMGTTIETEEGLCTLGGEMCSSLSEPPPDMFDLSIVNSSYAPSCVMKERISTHIPKTSALNISENTSKSSLEENLPSSEPKDYEKYESYDSEGRNDGTPLSNIPLNSESSSPAVNIDENSCEIPVQPQIVTDLSSSSFETHETTDSADFESNKRNSIDDSIENEKKKIKFD